MFFIIRARVVLCVFFSFLWHGAAEVLFVCFQRVSAGGTAELIKQTRGRRFACAFYIVARLDERGGAVQRLCTKVQPRRVCTAAGSPGETGLYARRVLMWAAREVLAAGPPVSVDKSVCTCGGGRVCPSTGGAVMYYTRMSVFQWTGDWICWWV